MDSKRKIHFFVNYSFSGITAFAASEFKIHEKCRQDYIAYIRLTKNGSLSIIVEKQ